MKLTFAILVGITHLLSVATAQERKVPEYEAALIQHTEAVTSGSPGRLDQALNDLKANYLAALEREQKAAQNSGKLEEVLALKKEVENLKTGAEIIALDSTSPASLKKLRDVFERSASRIEKDREAAVLPYLKQWQLTLDQLVGTLTKAGRLEDALFVKQKRDEVAAPSPSIALAGPLGGDKAFSNTLGMKFIPLPGTNVLMCVHETRRRDYEAYVDRNPSANAAWKNPGKGGVSTSTDDDHPVVSVCWSDANAFCAWLSKKEGKTYRLPTDREWSFAVGVARSESKDAPPNSLSGRIQEEYPWGTNWPPTEAAGNFADTDYKTKFPSESIIDGYTDGFATTAPVMSFAPNKEGFHDLGGNVWEWCEDWYSSGKVDRVARGGSWTTRIESALRSSNRDHTPPDRRDPSWGFRCVLEIAP
jgi:hypothetical protein